MEDDLDDKIAIKKKYKISENLVEPNNCEDIVHEIDVIVTEDVPACELFTLQFPKRKEKVFSKELNPRIRYKKNVRMLEMRFSPNIYGGSFDRTKSEKHKSESPIKSPVKSDSVFPENDEVFEGRAYKNDEVFQNTVGILRDGALYLTPALGCFSMHRVVKQQINTTTKKMEEDDFPVDSDSDVPSSSRQLRVKFTRPETERQKKRREASALHIERLIASDQWLNLDIYYKEDTESSMKLQKIIPRYSDLVLVENRTTRELAQLAIICEKEDQLDLTRENQMMSYLRIRELPLHLQVKAQVMKAKVISTSNVERLIPGISRDELISCLRQCAHLVQGVWVLRSKNLFHGIPPAHSNVPGKTDENRTILWRNARDFVLCILSGEHRVNRLTLSRCFKLNTTDAEEILSTVGVKEVGTWKLQGEPDVGFLKDPANLNLIVEERRFWLSRWTELKRSLHTC